MGDLLNLDLTPPATAPAPTSGIQIGAVDLLGGGLDSLVGLLCTVSHHLKLVKTVQPTEESRRCLLQFIMHAKLIKLHGLNDQYFMNHHH